MEINNGKESDSMEKTENQNHSKVMNFGKIYLRIFKNAD